MFSRLWIKISSNLKDEHGEYSMSSLYLLISLIISFILLLAVLYQIQEKTFVQDELDKQKRYFEDYKATAEESVSNYQTLLSEKENLDYQYSKLEKELEDYKALNTELNNDKTTLNQNFILKEKEARSYKNNLDLLIKIIYEGNPNPLEKYYNELAKLEKLEDAGTEQPEEIEQVEEIEPTETVENSETETSNE